MHFAWTVDFEALKNSDDSSEENADDTQKADVKPAKEVKPKVAKKPSAKVNTKNVGAKQNAMPRKTGGGWYLTQLNNIKNPSRIFCTDFFYLYTMKNALLFFILTIGTLSALSQNLLPKIDF